MDTGVGRTLRETRARRKIDLSEVETSTRIRLRYLRAIENEEWDLLPGDAYARGFIRAYADYLGLDGARLAEAQRRQRGAALPGDGLARDGPPPRPRRLPGAPRLSPRVVAVIVSAALVALAVVIGLSTGGQGSHGTVAPVPATPNPASEPAGEEPVRSQPKPAGHSLKLLATAEVWVCLLDGEGRPLVDGQILDTGSVEGPYRSGSFTVSLGNGEVTMTVDGHQASIPETSSPIGFSVLPGGHLRELPEGERPSCT
jgi:hypothetical protein